MARVKLLKTTNTPLLFHITTTNTSVFKGFYVADQHNVKLLQS